MLLETHRRKLIYLENQLKIIVLDIITLISSPDRCSFRYRVTTSWLVSFRPCNVKLLILLVFRYYYCFLSLQLFESINVFQQFNKILTIFPPVEDNV
jgi:hypothetical protein